MQLCSTNTHLIGLLNRVAQLENDNVMVGVDPTFYDDRSAERDVERSAVILDHGRADRDRVSNGQSGLLHGLRDVHLVRPLVGPRHLVRSAQDVETSCADL